MAVYTKITNQDIDYLFQDYHGIEQIKGIAEGVENTNYLVKTKNQNKFIFTIFEKRTKGSDLPFFHKAMNEFNHKGIVCPFPITVNENDIFEIKEKPCAIYSFIEGNQIQSLNNEAINCLSFTLSKSKNGNSLSTVSLNLLLANKPFVLSF